VVPDAIVSRERGRSRRLVRGPGQSALRRGRPARSRGQQPSADIRVHSATHQGRQGTRIHTVDQKSKLLVLSEYVNKTDKIGGT